MIPNGTKDGPGGVAGDDTSRGCFAVAHRTGIGVELHDNILNAVHSAQCRFERTRSGVEMRPSRTCVIFIVPSSFLFQRQVCQLDNGVCNDLGVLHQTFQIDAFIGLMLCDRVTREQGPKATTLGSILA